MFAVPSYHPVGSTPQWMAKRQAMFVPDAIRRCVVFLGVQYAEGRFKPKATGFLVDAGEGDSLRTHLVTAEHVISELHKATASNANTIAARLNTANGGSEIVSLSGAHWCLIPTLSSYPMLL